MTPGQFVFLPLIFTFHLIAPSPTGPNHYTTALSPSPRPISHHHGIASITIARTLPRLVRSIAPARFTRPLLHPPADLIQARPLPPCPGEAREIPPRAGPLLARLVCRAPNCSRLPPVAALHQKLLLHLLFSSFTPPHLAFALSRFFLSSLSSFFSSLYPSHLVASPTSRSFTHDSRASLSLTPAVPVRPARYPTTNVNTASSRPVPFHLIIQAFV